jgi:hypothetical protein
MFDTIKRLEGETRSNWDIGKNFGFIEFENNHGRVQTMFYSSRNIRCDWKGSRAWAFGSCIPVSFMIAHRNGKPHAEDVAPIFPMSEPEDLAAYRETGELVSKTFDHGFVQRPCGDRLFIHLNDVIDGFRSRWNLLESGSPVYYGVRFDEGTQRWRADYIELYGVEELLSFRQGLEPEPQVEVKAEPVLESLAPQNKNKTFLQLALEKRVRDELPKKDQGQ